MCSTTSNATLLDNSLILSLHKNFINILYEKKIVFAVKLIIRNYEDKPLSVRWQLFYQCVKLIVVETMDVVATWIQKWSCSEAWCATVCMS